MKVITILSLTAVLVANLGAQPSKAKSADDDWAELDSLAARKPSKPLAPGTKKTPDQVAAERAQRAAVARQAVQAAKDFYTKHPAHYKADEARKLEAVQGLLAVTDGDRQAEHAAQQAAKAYRERKSSPVGDRFDVALLSERVDARGKLGKDGFGNVPSELERIAEKLRAEFGDIPEVHNFYVSVARGADMSSAQRIAARVLQWKVGPDAKAEAQSIVERHALLNTRLGWSLSELDKKEALELKQQTGKPTLIYVSWFDSGGTHLAPLRRYKDSIPAGVQLIYLTLGATEAQVRGSQSLAPIPGKHCFEPRGALGPTAEQLNVRHTPYVYVLNSTGALAGYGPLSEVSNLISSATR